MKCAHIDFSIIIRAVLFGLWVCVLPVAQAYDYSLRPSTNGLPADYKGCRAGAEVGATIRLEVTDEGIYRVTYQALTNAGVASASLVGSAMRLFCRTQEVAIWVSNTNQWSTTNDYLLFPGTAFDGYYSMTNVYWLGFGSGGKRMATRGGSLVGGLTPVTSSRKTALHHVDYWYLDLYRPDDEGIDHWVDRYGSTNTVAVPFSLSTDRVVTSDPAVFQAVMMGVDNVLTPIHNTQIKIGGTSIVQFLYERGTVSYCATNFSAVMLQATNSVVFNQVGGGADAAYIERFSITYSRTLYQEGGALLFDGWPGSNNFRVTGFSSSNNLMVFDVTDPVNAVVVTGGAPTNMGGGLFAQQFGAVAGQTSRYAVVQSGGIKDVGWIKRVYFRDLLSTNQAADYLVICPYSFRQQVYRLLALRHSQGLTVAVAPLPDVYNEFSYGIADAAAIKQFLGYAFHHWIKPPKYVLLVGGGTYDPRQHETSAVAIDILPVHLGRGYLLWSALDGWYAAVNGADFVPDIALGRIPVETSGQLKYVIDKIVSFEGVPASDPWRFTALLAADNNDVDLDFKGASDSVQESDLPATFALGVNKAYQGTLDGSSANIINQINSGEFLVNYFGHGALREWAGDPVLFSADNIASLINTNYPIVSMLTCVNGAFQSTKYECMAETFLVSRHGAAACIAASGLSTLFGSQKLIHGFYGALLTERRKRIGDAMLPAYSALYTGSGNTRELLFFELFGDPAMIVNP